MLHGGSRDEIWDWFGYCSILFTHLFLCLCTSYALFRFRFHVFVVRCSPYISLSTSNPYRGYPWPKSSSWDAVTEWWLK